MLSVDELKTKGNQAFEAGRHEEAIKYFSEAIEQSPTNHVLFSNRSAAYASLNKFDEALADANKTVELNGSWAKGYSRQGAALYGRGDFEEAKAAYTKGLAIDSSNAQLQQGLKQVESAMEKESSNPFGNMNFVEKISKNPKLRHLLNDPEFIAKLQRLETNPNSMGEMFKDPRMMSVMSELLGIKMFDGNNMPSDHSSPHVHGANCHHSDDSDGQEDYRPMQTSTPKPTSAPSPATSSNGTRSTPATSDSSVPAEKRQADLAKELGNEAYKKKKFEEALGHYEEAWKLYPSDIAYLNNRAAVFFEMHKFDDCIKACEEAIEKGRELRADFKLVAKAFSRMGSAYLKLERLDEAIQAFNKSLTEFRSPDTLSKLRETEKILEKRKAEAYFSPEQAEVSKNEGNELFRQGNFVEALKHYSEAIKRNPNDARYYGNRSACYMKLMSYNEAMRDCDTAIKLDASFIKAYLRKAAVLFMMKEYQRAIDVCQEALEKEVDAGQRAELEEQMRKCFTAIQAQQSTLTEEEISQQAMKDPEVQEIMGDPAMRSILQQMSTDPKAIMEHMKNPVIARKMRKLMAAGIVKMGPR